MLPVYDVVKEVAVQHVGSIRSQFSSDVANTVDQIWIVNPCISPLSEGRNLNLSSDMVILVRPSQKRIKMKLLLLKSTKLGLLPFWILQSEIVQILSVPLVV